MKPIPSVLIMTSLVLNLVAVGVIGLEQWRVRGQLDQFAKSNIQLEDKLNTSTASLQQTTDTQNSLRTAIGDLQIKHEWLANQVTSVKSSVILKPELVLSEPIYNSTQNDQTIKTTGLSTAIKAWKQRNSMFLDQLLTQSMALGYDRATQNVTVTDVVPQSLFAEMGFLPGDQFVNIDGKVMVKGQEMRQTLADGNNHTVALIRNNKPVTLTIEHTIPVAETVALPVSQTAFIRSVMQATNATLDPVDPDSLTSGVKVTNLPADHPLTQIKLQVNDVISFINGQAADQVNWVKQLAQNDAGHVTLNLWRGTEPVELQLEFVE